MIQIKTPLSNTKRQDCILLLSARNLNLQELAPIPLIQPVAGRHRASPSATLDKSYLSIVFSMLSQPATDSQLKHES